MLVSVKFYSTSSATSHAWFRGPLDHAEIVDALMTKCRYSLIKGSVSVDISALTHWQKVNCVSLVHKCIKHLFHVAGRTGMNLPLDPRNRPSRPRAWRTYSESDESIHGLVEYCQTMLVGVSITDTHLTIDLIESAPRVVAAAFIYRVVNMVRWSASSNLKLSSKSYMSWDTFERITKRLEMTHGLQSEDDNEDPAEPSVAEGCS